MATVQRLPYRRGQRSADSKELQLAVYDMVPDIFSILGNYCDLPCTLLCLNLVHGTLQKITTPRGQSMEEPLGHAIHDDWEIYAARC